MSIFRKKSETRKTVGRVVWQSASGAILSGVVVETIGNMLMVRVDRAFRITRYPLVWIDSRAILGEKIQES